MTLARPVAIILKHLTELEEKVLGSIKSGAFLPKIVYPVQILPRTPRSSGRWFWRENPKDYFTGIKGPFNRGFERKWVKAELRKTVQGLINFEV